MNDHEVFKQAVRKVSDAAKVYGRAINRSRLKKISHRNPTERKVQQAFNQWLVSGGIEEIDGLLLTEIRFMETELKKPTKEWGLEEKLEMCAQMERLFLRLAEVIEKKKGRPRNQRGIIANCITANVKTLRKNEKEHINAIVDNFLKHETARKKGKYSKSEGFKLNELPKFNQYMAENPDKISMGDISKERLPGFMDKFMAEWDIPPNQKNAFKMRVSRHRRKHH